MSLFCLGSGARLLAQFSFVHQKVRHKNSVITKQKGELLKHARTPKQNTSSYFLASKIRLNGVSVALRNSLKPPARTVLRIASSVATAPSAAPFCANELEVQQSVEAPEKVRPMILKFS